MSKKKGLASSGGGFKSGAAARMQQKQQAKLNPFELKVNKPKFSILNRQVAGTSGRPIQSRARSFELRKKALVPELTRRGRSGEFVDRRFGERNRSLSTDEKMLTRFSKERMRSNKKKASFNLQEEEDYSHTLKLTHRGHNIDDLEDLDSEPDVSDNDSEGGLDRHVVSSGHFGGGAEDGRRTKSEIMQEVIAKSKMHKHERQKVKEENANLCDDLDAEFSSLVGILETRDSRPAPIQKTGREEEPDDYTEFLKAMTFDRRAQPTDRLKTLEELKAEAAEKITKSQKQKALRMAGQDGDALEPDFESDKDTSGDEEDKASSVETDADRSLRKVTTQVTTLLDTIITESDLTTANKAYSELAKICMTNSVIPVAKVLRERLTTIMEACERPFVKGSAPVMPNRETLLLFHLIGRIFSTSDYHHIVVTPAQLLMTIFISSGRITRKAHVLSALFLMQTFLHYQRDSTRYMPEMFALLSPLLTKTFTIVHSDAWCPLPRDRFMSQSVYEFLAGEGILDRIGDIRPISFNDLLKAEEDDDYLSRAMIAGFLLHIVKGTCALYTANDSSPELLLPLLQGLKEHPCCADIVSPLILATESKRNNRLPLQYQKFKAIAIPQLTPDLNDGPSREEVAHLRLKKTYKREFKGAKRELKRDSTFLAKHKLEARLEADRKYQERQRQIMGSISNESNPPRDSKKRRYR